MDVVDKSGPFMSLILHRLDLNNLPRVTSEDDDAGGSEVKEVDEVNDVQVLSEDSSGDGGKNEGSEFESEVSGIQGTRRSGRLSKRNKKSMKDLDSESEDQTSSQRGRKMRSRKRKEDDTDESDSDDITVVRRSGRRSMTKKIDYAEKPWSDTKSDVAEQASSSDSCDLSFGKTQRGRPKGPTKAKKVAKEKPQVHEITEIHPVQNSDLPGSIKRGRGRPRKNETPVSDDSGGVPEPSKKTPGRRYVHDSSSSKDSEDTKPKVAKIQKKRGRPRKNQTPVNTESFPPENPIPPKKTPGRRYVHESSSSEDSEDSKPKVAKIQKKRGRPRKNQTPVPCESFLSENPIPSKKTPERQDAESDDSGENYPIPPKKTPGRRYVHDSSPSEDSEDSKPKVAKIQKKRGRPRKSQTPVAAQSILPENQENLVTALKESVDAAEVSGSESEDQTSSKRGHAMMSTKRKKEETDESDSDDVSIVRRSGRRSGTENINYGEKPLSDTKSDLEEQASSSASSDSELSFGQSERGQPKSPRRGQPKGSTKAKNVAKEKPHVHEITEIHPVQNSDLTGSIKRGRGRPSTNKTAKPSTAISNDGYQDVAGRLQHVVNDFGGPTQKKRGRPRKNQTPVPTKSFLPENPIPYKKTLGRQDAESDDSGENYPIPPNKTPARRYIHDSSRSEDSEDSKPKVDKIQKKRGRPRKNQAPVPTESFPPENPISSKKTLGRHDAESHDSGEGLHKPSKKTPVRRYGQNSSSSEDSKDHSGLEDAESDGSRSGLPIPYKNTPQRQHSESDDSGEGLPIPYKKTPGRRYVHASSSSEDSEDSKPKVAKIQKNRPETLKAEPQPKVVENLSNGKFMLSSAKIKAAQSKSTLPSGNARVKLRLP